MTGIKYRLEPAGPGSFARLPARDDDGHNA